MKYNIVAIDPGYSNGGIATINTAGIAGAIKMPQSESEIREYFKSLYHPQTRYIMEAVHASPQQGASTGFKFGEHFGYMKGVLPFIFQGGLLISPQKWQAALNCRTGGDKNISKARAQELFPDIKVTLATADALCLAYYGYLYYGK